MVREMWTSLFEDWDNIDVIGQCGNFAEAIEMIKSKTPDIVLLDINLPDASGFDAVPVILKFSPTTKIIAVSMHHQPIYAHRMLSLGARGYITKGSPSQEILDAVGEVMDGKTYICLEIRERM